VEVVERGDDGLPVKIRIGSEIYENMDGGTFLVEISKVRGIKLKEIPEGVVLHIVQILDRDENSYQKISYSILDSEILYSAPNKVWVRIFEFKPRKYLDIRFGRRRVDPLTFLEAYFKALKSAPELDNRVKVEEEEHWNHDLEQAEAYLSIELDPDLTLEKSVNEVKQIFRRIDEVTFSMLHPPRKKSLRQHRGR